MLYDPDPPYDPTNADPTSFKRNRAKAISQEIGVPYIGCPPLWLAYDFTRPVATILTASNHVPDMTSTIDFVLRVDEYAQNIYVTSESGDVTWYFLDRDDGLWYSDGG